MIVIAGGLALAGCKRGGAQSGASTPPSTVVEQEGAGVNDDACAAYLAGAPPELTGDMIPASAEDLAAAQAMAREFEDPRCAHYVFAHQMLPYQAFDDPRIAAVLWVDPNVLDFVQIFAEGSNEMCAERQPEWQLPTRAFNVGRTELLERPVVVIEVLTPPVATTEAYLIALVGRPWTSLDEPGQWTSLDGYFVLEHSAFSDTGTVLGGWTPSQGSLAHLNMGSGPEPTIPGFLQVVGQNLCGDFVEAKTQM